MYALPTSNYLRRSMAVNNHQALMAKRKLPPSHEDLVKEQLVDAGITKNGLRRSEAKYLPHILHPDEFIGGAVFGRHPDGFALLVATDRRVIFLDTKPLFVNEDEISYDIVSGVSRGSVGIATTVTLHTRLKDFPVKTLNRQSAEKFVQYIEARKVERNNWE